MANLERMAISDLNVGTFRQADKNTLQGRVIKKAVRRGLFGSCGSGGFVNWSNKISVNLRRERKTQITQNFNRLVKNMDKKSPCLETTDQSAIQIFHKILQSPGLFWIGEKIFIDLIDQETFAQCELVCSTWRWFFIEAELWKKWLMKNTASKGDN